MKKKRLFLEVIKVIRKQKLLTLFVILLSLSAYPMFHNLYYKNVKTFNFEVELYEFYNLDNKYFNYQAFVYSLKIRLEDTMHSLNLNQKYFKCHNDIVFKIDCNYVYFETSGTGEEQKEINSQLLLTYQNFFNQQKKKFNGLIDRTNRDIENKYNRKNQLQSFYEESRKEKDITADFYYFDSTSSFDETIYELEVTLNTYGELIREFDNKINELEMQTQAQDIILNAYNSYRHIISILVSIILYVFMILLFTT